MNKLTKVIGLSVLAVGVLGACGEQTVEKTNTSPAVQQKVSENKTTPAPAPAQKKPESKAKIGESLDVSGVKITVTSIDPFVGRINQYNPLKQDHAVKVGIIVENDTQDQIFVDSHEFKLYDKDGFELGSALPGDEMSLSGEIPAGKKVQGAVYFDVPKQEGANWEIQYESMSSFGGDPAKWEVPAK